MAEFFSSPWLLSGSVVGRSPGGCSVKVAVLIYSSSSLTKIPSLSMSSLSVNSSIRKFIKSDSFITSFFLIVSSIDFSLRASALSFLSLTPLIVLAI